MRLKISFLIFLVLTLVVGYFFILQDTKLISTDFNQSFTATKEAGFEDEPTSLQSLDYQFGQGGWYTLDELRNWKRAPGPLKVGLQVGHLNNDNVPEELSGLARNGAGATSAGYNERDTVKTITELVAKILEAQGISVDILPATIPPGYEADAFVSIHADGNPDSSIRGFKHAGPRRDYSGRSEALVSELYKTYAESTNLPIDPSVSRRMTAYYAFNWARYEHAVHPFTPSAIVETGFLTNPIDRDFLLNQPERVAAGIATGIINFLEKDSDPVPPPLSLTAPNLPLEGTVECAEVREERRNRSARPCEAALTDSEGNQFLLIAEPAIATSSLPYRATVDGDYMPVQMLDNYFWFHWEVLGIIKVDQISTE